MEVKLLQKAVLKSIKEKITNLLEGKKQQTTSILDKEHVITLTDKNFNDLVKYSDDAWMVLFFAPWCGHCQNLEPHWNAAARQLSGKVKFGAYDCTVYSTRSKEYKIQSYPTVKLFIPKSDANTQPKIEQVLQIGGSGYPTLVAVDYNNKSFATFVGAFTQDKYGLKTPILVKTFPEVIVVDPWDGYDKDVSVVNEKIEL
ncbi:protein disulfide-isomerase A6 homolog [Diabrotica virgifera virgifera]|uniref:Thioredoxin domain-containing protein n=1 Tax=Diabrotica virgifera virgifera TaxID=50390 RepID=A0ABM5JS54_DIAVI|nr:protein disulfide-isomerase A6 homolog [Diabrotica virgifera virgifera]